MERKQSLNSRKEFQGKNNLGKMLFFIFAMILCVGILSGCNKKEEKKEEKKDNVIDQNNIPSESAVSVPDKIDVKIAVLKGPTAMGIVEIMNDTEEGMSANNYEFTIAGTADEISAGIIQGNYDIAAVPCNLAAVLYNKTEKQIQVAGINTLGVLYIVESGDTIHSVEDLKGKTIYSTGKGTTPEYTLNYLLSKNGIDPEKDVTIEYKTEATEVAAILAESENVIAMLPQPFVTSASMQNEKIRIALDVTKEWEKISEGKSSVVTGVVIVRKEFMEQNPEVVETFLKEYKASTEFVNEKPKEAAKLIEQYGIIKADVAEKAIPYCNIGLITGEDMKTKIEGYLTTLFEQNPKTIGGFMPEEDFYYIAQ